MDGPRLTSQDVDPRSGAGAPGPPPRGGGPGDGEVGWPAYGRRPQADVPRPAGAAEASDPPSPSTSALLDALFANAPVGLGFWDRELRYRRVNGQLAAMNGVPVEAHLGRRPSEVLPALGPHLEHTLQRILDTDEAVRDMDVAGETPAAPGVVRHWLASYFPVRDPHGTTVGISGLVVEVTGERQASVRADEALRRSAFVDAELRALDSALPIGVGFLSPDLRYQRVNEALADERTLGRRSRRRADR